MEGKTRQVIQMLLDNDNTVSKDERFWLEEIMSGRLPNQNAMPDGPNLSQVEAAKMLGYSDVTMATTLKNLHYGALPEDLWPQAI